MSKLILAFLFASILGCAGNVVVKVPTQQEQNLLANVIVNDLRAPGVAASTREAAFGTPMGNITFEPPEAQIVKNLLETELTRNLRAKGIQTPQTYVCDITDFGVNTNATLLYWDVAGRIRLLLKHDGKEYNLSGEHTERTYVWPGESVIAKVIDKSLQQISSGLKQLP